MRTSGASASSSQSKLTAEWRSPQWGSPRGVRESLATHQTEKSLLPPRSSMSSRHTTTQRVPGEVTSASFAVPTTMPMIEEVSYVSSEYTEDQSVFSGARGDWPKEVNFRETVEVSEVEGAESEEEEEVAQDGPDNSLPLIAATTPSSASWASTCEAIKTVGGGYERQSELFAGAAPELRQALRRAQRTQVKRKLEGHPEEESEPGQ